MALVCGVRTSAHRTCVTFLLQCDKIPTLYAWAHGDCRAFGGTCQLRCAWLAHNCVGLPRACLPICENDSSKASYNAGNKAVCARTFEQVLLQRCVQRCARAISAPRYVQHCILTCEAPPSKTLCMLKHLARSSLVHGSITPSSSTFTAPAVSFRNSGRNRATTLHASDMTLRQLQCVRQTCNEEQHLCYSR